MGNINPADNQDVEHTSGVQRLCSAIFCALCIAPILLLGSCGMLGWNERRAVCDSKAIAQGKEEVVEVGCGSPDAGNGDLVMFSCDLSIAGLPPLRPINSDFENYIEFYGVGLSATTEMLQCVEHKHSETKKDSVGGGTTTVHTYTYSVEWRSSHINSYSFQKLNSMDWERNCGSHNPDWPVGFPTFGTLYQNSAKAGAFALPRDFVSMVPINTDLSNYTAPPGWSKAGASYTTRVGVGRNGIGESRVRFTGNDWRNPRITVLGENKQGTIQRWTASDSWLCSGFTLRDLRTGDASRDDLFAALASEASALTWVLRFLGFILMWFAFSRLFGPLEVAADCIPCVGPCLGDSIAAIACCVSCLPGCACALGVIGIVWVVMRPAVGIPLILFFILVLAGFVGYKFYRKSQGGEAREVEVVEPKVEEENAAAEEA